MSQEILTSKRSVKIPIINTSDGAVQIEDKNNYILVLEGILEYFNENDIILSPDMIIKVCQSSLINQIKPFMGNSSNGFMSQNSGLNLDVGCPGSPGLNDENKFNTNFDISDVSIQGEKNVTYANQNANQMLENQSFKTMQTAHEGWVEFECEMLNGKKQGHGRWFHKNGKLRYEGEFHIDKPQSDNATFYYNNGSVEYCGKLLGGCYEGWGKLYHPNGMLWYDGEFDDNVPHGDDCVLYKKKRQTAYDGKITNGVTEDGKQWHTYF